MFGANRASFGRNIRRATAKISLAESIRIPVISCHFRPAHPANADVVKRKNWATHIVTPNEIRRRIHMKKRAYTIIAAIALFGGLGTSARAQCFGIRSTTANVPFKFTAREKALPAGNYTISCARSNPHLLVIQSADGDTSFIAANLTSAPSPQLARLVFRCYGDRYFLAQVWIDGTEDGLVLPKSHAERRLQRELKTIKPTKADVVLQRR